MKILFIGCVESSKVFLNALLENDAGIVGVITKEKSSFNADFADITPLCKEHDIPYHYVQNVNDDDAKQFIMDCRPDIGYCFGWSQLIKDELIDLFPKGIVGYHPAELPNNRGRHPIIWALALGLNRTASSFFMIEKTADTGDVVSQKKVDISYEDDAKSLMNKLLDLGTEQIIALTKDFELGEVKRVPQDKESGNSWRKRGRLDGQIDWRMSSKSIYNLVRALTRPYVGAHFICKDEEVKVWKVREVIDYDNRYVNIEPGKVIDVLNDSIIVKTGDNLIELLEYESVQISVGDYL